MVKPSKRGRDKAKMKRQKKNRRKNGSWKEVNLPFAVVPLGVRPVMQVKFDDVAWVKELLMRPVSVREVQS